MSLLFLASINELRPRFASTSQFRFEEDRDEGEENMTCDDQRAAPLTGPGSEDDKPDEQATR